MTKLFIDVHILQTVPPSNLNRDDTGSPKTALYGGTRRARVSSQAWKRPTRLALGDHLDRSELGVRTKRVVELLTSVVAKQAPDLDADRHEAIASAMLNAAGIKLSPPRRKKDDPEAPDEAGYLLFLGRRQYERLAEAGIVAEREGRLESIEKDKAAKKSVQEIVKDGNPVDVALFGRMVADVSDLSVDAAVQVAHAISVHTVENEYDYFTAVDDHKKEDREEDSGAGMIGTVEFNSSTLYRFATINVPQLRDNLGDALAARRAAEAFLKGFITSMPTGKITTFGNRTLPDVVLVTARTDQPISFVGAFEESVPADVPGGRSAEAARRLAAYSRDVTAAYGLPADHAWVLSIGSKGEELAQDADRVTFDELVDQVGAHAAAALAAVTVESA